MKKKIMFVDDSKTNLVIGKSLLSPKYEVYTMLSGDKLFEMLEAVTPDLILLDVEMPDMNGFEVLERLKEMESARDIPVIFLTAQIGADSELEGLSKGAVDYITKPFSPPLLLKRIELHLLLQEQRSTLEKQKAELEFFNDNLKNMVQQKTATVVELQNAILQAIAEMVEFRDDVTGGHIAHTQAYLEILVSAMIRRELYIDEADEWDFEFFLPSSQLHDVGKIAVPDSILMKPARLSPEEYETIKLHVQYGVDIIDHIAENTRERDFLKMAKIFAESHHERWDGKGYPHGLSGTEIPLPGRLLAIVDVYDALSSTRPYKPPLPHAEAVEIIKSGRGTQFDPNLVDVFLEVADMIEEQSKLST